MDQDKLIQTAQAMIADHKGLLAMDESTPTCNKRFANLGIAQTAEMRASYREMLITTPHLSAVINAAILYDETIRQKLSDGRTFIKAVKEAKIIPGIKVDMGTKDLIGFPGEKTTLGLDGLHDRLLDYADMGLRFAKWRAVITIGDGIPTYQCIENNAVILARYAALCQEAGLVPIVEPEVIMNGKHNLKKCLVITQEVLHVVFKELYKQRVVLEAMLLKPNMILPGLECSDQSNKDEIAHATIKCLFRSVPAAVPGIVFLSGGQASELATARLNAMNSEYKSDLPWALTFSFSRALQYPAMEIWNGKNENINIAQQALYHRAKLNVAASRGDYNSEMEDDKGYLNQ